jgi:hypothetical protein
MELEPLGGVLRLKGLHRIGRHRRGRRHVGHEPAIATAELESAFGQLLDLISLLVHYAVMAPAK